MTFQTLYGGELFCMPDTFGERHALQAWGTCNTSTQQYSIGQPKTVPQVALKQTNKGLKNAMSGNGWGFSQPLQAQLRQPREASM